MRHSGTLLSVVVAVGVLAGCDDRPDLSMYDPRVAHPLSAEAKTAVLVIEVPVKGAGLGMNDRLRLDRFARDFGHGGDGPVEVMVGAAPGGEAEANAFAAEMARALAARGVQSSRIYGKVVVGAEVAPGTAVLRGRLWQAVVPECGNWSREASLDPLNSNMPNFGCATQRNIGLMVANPRDLVEPDHLQPHDGALSSRMLDRYRAGEDTRTYRIERDQEANQ